MRNRSFLASLVIYVLLLAAPAHAKDCDWVFDNINKNDLNFPDENCSMNFHNTLGETPLFAAFGGGHLEMARKIIDHGADVNLNTRYGNNIIVVALASGRPGFDLITTHGWKPVNTIDISGQLLTSMRKSFGVDKIPTMLLAVIQGEVAVEYLYKSGVRIDPGYDSFLIDNLLNVDYRDLPALKKSGLNINAYSPSGWTLLHFAVGMKNINLTRALLSIGADKYLIDGKLGVNSIELATRTGNKNIINCVTYNKCN